MTSSCHKGFALTSDLILSERICTYIRTHLVRKDLHLHLTSYCQKGFALTSDLILSERLCTYIQPHLLRKDLHLHPTSSCQKDFALTSDLILSKRICTYILSCGNTSRNQIRTSLHLYLIMWEHIPQSHQNGFTLISDHVGTHPAITSEWLCTYI